MDREIWKDVQGYESLYKVSNFGRIKRIYKNRKPKILSLNAKDNCGYLQVSLCKNGKITSKRVHNIVANTFLQKQKKDLDVNHIDGNKENNNVCNLEFISHRENIIHSYKNGLRSKEKIKYTCSQMHKSREIKIKRIIGDSVYYFESIIKASIITKLNHNTIRRYLKKITKPKDNSIWEYC